MPRGRWEWMDPQNEVDRSHRRRYLLREERYRLSYSESPPDFVKLAEARGANGLRGGPPPPPNWTARSWKGWQPSAPCCSKIRELPADDPVGQASQRNDLGRGCRDRRRHRQSRSRPGLKDHTECQSYAPTSDRDNPRRKREYRREPLRGG
jgi:hypothetical protein